MADRTAREEAAALATLERECGHVVPTMNGCPKCERALLATLASREGGGVSEPRWEVVGKLWDTLRLAVPGGWLYRMWGGPMCFVPDPLAPSQMVVGGLRAAPQPDPPAAPGYCICGHAISQHSEGKDATNMETGEGFVYEGCQAEDCECPFLPAATRPACSCACHTDLVEGGMTHTSRGCCGSEGWPAASPALVTDHPFTPWPAFQQRWNECCHGVGGGRPGCGLPAARHAKRGEER